MHDISIGWGALCALVFLLGTRHGLDADHLATIDGLTRLSHRDGQRHARWCGALFAIGHGAVVVTMAAGVGALSREWLPPPWIDAVGAWISIGFLLVLGVANLRAALNASPGAAIGLIGARGPLLGALLRRLPTARGPLAAAAVGALFALSFDTLSQAALLAVTATRFGGAAQATALGALFVIGMLLVDGVNGWWIAHLIARADRAAARASRVMAFTVAFASLLVATLGAARLLSVDVERWSDGKELALGAGVLLLVALGYAIARRHGRRRSHRDAGGAVAIAVGSERASRQASTA